MEEVASSPNWGSQQELTIAVSQSLGHRAGFGDPGARPVATDF